MRRIILLTLSLAMVAARSVGAGTFDKARIAPEINADALTRSVARQQLGRDLFSDPYSTVTIGNVDVYDVFPYLESRTFQIVSDPRWNRLVFGERGRSLKAYDGNGRPFGPLSDPRGLAVDEANHVYVADAGNGRILVFKASTEFGDVDLVPLYEIKGLGRPFDVAYSDGGTPFVAGDDYLYVADTGKNRVVSYAVADAGAREISAIGELGNGPGRFAGPMAVAAGRSGGANTSDVYVADAHSRRIVRLRNNAGQLQWVSDAQQSADIVTSLDTDQWGNVYAAAPNQGVVRKFNPQLAQVAELRGGLDRPRSFHVPVVSIHDHRANTSQRVGQPQGVSIEQWGDASGVRLWNLGVDVTNLSVDGGATPTAHFTLTDRANVSIEISDAASGQWLARRALGVRDAGDQSVALLEGGDAAIAGDVVLRVIATSAYPDGASASAQTAFRMNGNSVGLPSQAMLLGNSPNPVMSFTRIAFVLPAGGSQAVSLRVVDASGRLVRSFNQSFAPGRNEVVWDGTDMQGGLVPAGMYFYRLNVGKLNFTRKMVLVR